MKAATTNGRALAALALLWMFATGALAAPSDWNARISLVEVFASMPGAKGGVLLADENLASVFHVGQLVDIVCHYQYTKIGPDGAYPGFTVSFHARGSIFDTKAVAQSSAPFKSVWSSWILKEEGTYNLGCRINAMDADVDDNTGKRQITVLPAKSGEAGWLPAPAPQIVSPGAGQIFMLGPTLSLHAKARLPAKPFANQTNFVEYAKKTADVERWHMEIVRTGSGPLSAFETRVGELKGELSTIEFGAQLTSQWFEKNGAGPGNYALRTWITQQRQDGTYVGPSARVDFRLVEGKAALANTPPPIAQASPPPTPIDPATGRVGPGVPAPGPTRSSMPTAEGARGSAPGQTQLPAVQSPSTGGTSAPSAVRPSNWGSMPTTRNVPVPATQGPAPMSGPAATRGIRALDPDTARALAVASCTRVAGTTALHFACTSPAGLERCEALKQQNKVDQCALTGRLR